MSVVQMVRRNVSGVNDEDELGVGGAIRARRAALGLSVKALAERAGVDRGRLAAIEEGASARSATIGALESTLSRLEEEMGGPYDSEHGLVTFRLRGNFGIDVTLQGPVDNLDELEASVERLLAKMEQPPPAV